MPNYNRITIIGHLTKDIDIRYTADGTAIAKSGLATNYKYKDKEETCFIDFVFFGNQAETLANFAIKKGNALLVEGRLKLDTWEKDNVKHYKHNIVGERFVLMPKSGGPKRQEEVF